MNERKPWSSKESLIEKDGVGWVFRSSSRTSRRRGDLNCLHCVFFKIDIPSYEHSIARFLPHLFSELSKTELGFNYILTRGYIEKLLSELDDFHPKVSNDAHLKFRATLTAIGMIGSTESGFAYLDEVGMVKKITNQVMSCTILSIKSTCLYVVG